jgi:hypothetical protein
MLWCSLPESCKSSQYSVAVRMGIRPGLKPWKQHLTCTHKKTAKGDPKENALNSVLLVVQSCAWSQSKKKPWCEEGWTLSLSFSLSHIARCKSTALLCLACFRALEGALTDAQYESFARAHNSFEDYTGRRPSGRYRKAPSGKNRI